jgi:hypothetical protein
MLKLIRVADLPVSGNGRGIVLHCPHDGAEYSPDRGDYFWADPNMKLRCPCGAPLELVRKHVTYERLDT